MAKTDRDCETSGTLSSGCNTILVDGIGQVPKATPRQCLAPTFA
jgi:hypothetical protein